MNVLFMANYSLAVLESGSQGTFGGHKVIQVSLGPMDRKCKRQNMYVLEVNSWGLELHAKEIKVILKDWESTKDYITEVI
jgi:hypothetical protein